MRLTTLRIITLVLLAPCAALAYGQSYYEPYYEGTYYSQPAYYSQGTYYSQGYYQGSYATTTLVGNVRFTQDLLIYQKLSKGSGTFVIDHPMDPWNRLLYHSFVESPDVLNIYDGVATLDEHGETTIELPDYFMALNTHFRYQFFPHFEAMPDLHVKQEVQENRFMIGGGAPYGEVSWQVSGVRRDPYILANPIVNEVEKSPTELVDKGQCLYEPLCRE